jgi:hypothetical protein
MPGYSLLPDISLGRAPRTGLIIGACVQAGWWLWVKDGRRAAGAAQQGRSPGACGAGDRRVRPKFFFPWEETLTDETLNS